MALSQGIAFIGGGNMATALIQGLIATHTARREQLLVSDVRSEGLVQLRDKYGVRTTLDNRAACQSEILVLSVKPQNFAGLLPMIAPHLAPSTLIISIAAGVPLQVIEAALPQSRVVRAMPNTPALVLAGATAVAPGSKASAEDLALATKIFASVGCVVQVDEAQMDAVTALSGSGPAYVFLLAEALAAAGAEVGLAPDIAAVLAAQTVFGAGKLLAESTDAPGELRRKVTSPGGTTAAGIAALEARDFAGAIAACVRAAAARGAELGKEAAGNLPSGKSRS
jgi:pyrroline-5-carboxylate reductase